MICNRFTYLMIFAMVIHVLTNLFWLTLHSYNQSSCTKLTLKDVSFNSTCGCPRTITMNPCLEENEPILFKDTTCGYDAYRRGRGQKVIGFALYGNLTETNRGYMNGVRGNLNLMERFYPGWIFRLYIEMSENGEERKEFCEMACQNRQLDLCDVKDLPGRPMTNAQKVFPMLWRFFPTLDPQVEVFLSRDLDSWFSTREVSAVKDWLDNSREPLHSMRDHIYHDVPLLGASWGTHLGRKNARRWWAQSWSKILLDKDVFESRLKKGPDQALLKKHVWTWGKDNAVQHDAYYCMHYPRGSRPFPTQRLIEPNNYVASAVSDNITERHPCPKFCRPKEHQNWRYC